MRKIVFAGRLHSEDRRAGFTLVEMLVSVALVLIMMVMFTQVFVMSTTSLSQQRGIAENDQRERMISMTIRGDLNGRTFRDVLPFRANEDTRALGHSIARRAGYLEIYEGNTGDDTDDILQFTASANIRLQSNDNSAFLGSAQALSMVGTNANGVAVNVTASGGSSVFEIQDNGAYTNKVANQSRIWVVGIPNVTSNTPYVVSFVTVTNAGSPTPPHNTQIGVTTPISQTGSVTLYLSENEPEFDDGLINNSNGMSALAEVCYFLRNGILYRRVLLIRDTAAGGDSQPSWSTGAPILWNGSNGNYSPASSTFWRDFDYSAFYYNGNNAGLAPGVRFHNAAESLSNSSQSSLFFMNSSTFPFSLGIPHLRFGHSTTNGLPQDASTTTPSGAPTGIGRFNLQECSNSLFGYPGYLPAGGSPFDSQNIVVDANTGLVAALETDPTTSPPARRGQDILLSNVLSFDVKVWDPLSGTGGAFVDVGTSLTPTSPLGMNAGVITDLDGNIVGGRLNTTYGPNNHYRFDTWHPNASVTTSNFPTSQLYPSYPASPTFYAEPPYYNLASAPSAPYTYNEPPYVPVTVNPATGTFQAAPLTAIQITINYRDVSSNQVRQLTLVQSLVDRVKRTSVTNEAAEE